MHAMYPNLAAPLFVYANNFKRPTRVKPLPPNGPFPPNFGISRNPAL